MEDFILKYAKKTPNKIAIIFKEKKVTYYELNKQVNSIANYLNSKYKDIKAIGLYMDRSYEMLLGVLVSLRLNIPYVMLNYMAPESRNREIIEASKINFVLTYDNFIASANKIIKNTINISTLEIDYNTKDIFVNPIYGATAYIMFTSGTTGVPKGVKVSREALNFFITEYSKKIQLSCDDKVDYALSAVFTGSIPCYLPPLYKGGTLVIQPEGILSNPKLYVESIIAQNINYLKFTPTIFEIVLPYLINYKNHKLNIILSGEKLLRSKIKDFIGDVNWNVYNQYGFTECVAGLTSHLLNKEDADSSISKYVPVGKCFPGRKILLLNDKDQEIKNCNVVGKLYAGGAGLADGYINEDSNSSFMVIAGERFYNTGDLAMFDYNNNINIIGRSDSQVKVNGVRIELSEIESAIIEHQNISNAYVMFNEEQGKIFAYFISNKEKNIKEKEIFNYLKNKLPHYMIPSVIIALENFPQTDNGKVDWRKLPLKKTSSDNSIDIENLTEKEHIILELWEEVLKEKIYSIDEDFFESGGTSLQAYQILIKLNCNFGLNLSIDYIFKNRTIRAQALYLGDIEDSLEEIDEEF
ncbi:non-ribosomal peptide synthetase [Francisella uliginis]|uniref:Carrier domain-containing protein n=1 Tax=Francisella uliginis TaxID=573570 RepID=A0A1L4BSI4_9GAMM|nr:non-ribosomal peptide synthetase [Francisella uliginis]API86806.1 hypothetical protein F7310_05305 [Francisella uliginis]